MFTLVIDGQNRESEKTAATYLAISLFTAFFGGVYEVFSHDVYSYYMLYAFMIPLAGGALPFLILALQSKWKKPGALSRGLYHAGIATLTVGCIMKGVLEIYGTTNRLLSFYWYIGIPLIVLAVVLYLVSER